jgi:homoserine O-acetyltransferase
MIVLCLAALAPERFDTIAPFAASESASPWVIGFNHIQREMLLFDPAWPNAERGLELARQLAHMTYRAEPGLIERHGRMIAWPPGLGSGWSSRQPYSVETYLEHQGNKLARRFDARAYFVQLGAMDHHDLARRPIWWHDDTAFGRDRIRANIVSVGINTDALYLPAHARRIAEPASHGVGERCYREISSPHGHDAFLMEWDDVDGALQQALAMAGVGSPSPTLP